MDDKNDWLAETSPDLPVASPTSSLAGQAPLAGLRDDVGRILDESLRDSERSIRQLLDEAQTIRHQARRDASRILQEARMEAGRVLAAAESSAGQLRAAVQLKGAERQADIELLSERIDDMAESLDSLLRAFEGVLESVGVLSRAPGPSSGDS